MKAPSRWSGRGLRGRVDGLMLTVTRAVAGLVGCTHETTNAALRLMVPPDAAGPGRQFPEAGGITEVVVPLKQLDLLKPVSVPAVVAQDVQPVADVDHVDQPVGHHRVAPCSGRGCRHPQSRVLSRDLGRESRQERTDARQRQREPARKPGTGRGACCLLACPGFRPARWPCERSGNSPA